MYCNIKFNSHGVQALVDTGAVVRIITHRVFQRYGLPIDTGKPELLCGFNSSTTRIIRITTINVSIGDHHCERSFRVIDIGPQKLILRNDSLINQDVILYPKRFSIQIQMGE